MYDTLARAEYVHQCLLALERALSAKGFVCPTPARGMAAADQLSGPSRRRSAPGGYAQAWPDGGREAMPEQHPISTQGRGLLPGSSPVTVLTPGAELEAAQEASTSASTDEYNFRALDELNVPYTQVLPRCRQATTQLTMGPCWQMGLLSTRPDQAKPKPKPTNDKKHIVDGLEVEWDAPCRSKVQKIPWNSKVPVTLTGTCPTNHWLPGEALL